MPQQQSTLQRKVDSLAERLSRSVAIDDPDMRLIYVSRHFGDEDPARVQAVLQRNPSPAVVGHVFAQGVTKWAAPGVIPARSDIGMSKRLCLPLRWRGTLVGLLMVIATDHPLDGDQLDTITAAGHDIAALLYRDHVSDDRERVVRERALWDLLSERPARQEAGLHFFDQADWLRRAAWASVTVAEVVEGAAGAEAEAEVALRSAIEGITHGQEGYSVCAATEATAVLLQLWNTPPASARLHDQASQIIEYVGKILGGTARCAVGIGDACQGWEQAWISRDQAGVAVRASVVLPEFRGIAAWSDLGAYAMLLRIPSSQLTPALLPAPLRALTVRDPDGRLRQTLATYLDNAGSSPAAAAALHIHRTSLYYRLHQIEDITGLHLDNGEHRLLLHLGLRIAALLDTRQ